MNPLVERIQESIRAGLYRLSTHAELEREAEEILISEIEGGVLSPQCEVVGDYPDDPRGHSALLLGFSSEGRPLHILLGFAQEDIIIVITVYRPNPGEWIDWRVRRGSHE
jgi:hypothetical protein